MSAELLGILSLAVALVGVIINGYNSRAKLKEQAIAAEARMSAIETKLGLVWKVTEMKLVGMLHHPDPDRKEADDLLDRYIDGQLDEPGCERLVELLRERMVDNTVHRFERVAAEGLICLLKSPDRPARRLTDNVKGPPILRLTAPGVFVRSLAKFVECWERMTHGTTRRRGDPHG